jgi:FKBP12-rapamycin complex-associated protein
VFEHALENTKGSDLDRVLWLKSPNSEVWLERRTNYTRSLAVMSMVGYILGLGDRHPSNLMLDQHTGKITHIDFGDCFEVRHNATHDTHDTHDTHARTRTTRTHTHTHTPRRTRR